MSAPRCPRLFEVEALRNGRLEGELRAHFERHLSTCGDCAGEARSLDALERALHESYPARNDELHVRRQRTRLLAAFDRTPHARSPSSARARWLGLAAAAALVTMLLLFWRSQHAATPAPAAAASALIRPEAGTQWSRRSEGARDHVTLQRGALWIRVAHPSASPALLVLLPDGELEDTGTTFSVSVDAGRTARVAVEEGSVTLRLHGRAPIRLGAGEIWTAAIAPAGGAAAPEATLEHESVVASARPVASPPITAAAPAPEPQPVASATTATASSDFRAAMSAFKAGQNREAAALLSRFLERHAGDPRAEDAAYVRILALRRAGDRAAATAAARDYLSRYPAGFRRTEVQALVEP